MKRLFALAFVVLALSAGVVSCSADDLATEIGGSVAPDLPDFL